MELVSSDLLLMNTPSNSSEPFILLSLI